MEWFDLKYTHAERDVTILKRM